jgi:thiosulfate dehydrogenase
MNKYLKEDWPMYLIFLIVALVITREIIMSKTDDLSEVVAEEQPEDYWIAPSLYTDNTTTGEQRKMIIYGQDIITNTASYFGPHGSVNRITNGMNCQNCHLNAGTKPWGNNYGAVASTYPKLRERSGTIESIPKRVNDCFERSLNGTAIDTASVEMRSIVAYMQWLGQNVQKGQKPKGSGINELQYLNRAASPANGQIVFNQKCQSCHGANGEGMKNPNEIGYSYPPLWGENSYNTGAGLFRLSRFAGYVKDNMPFNVASHKTPALTDEEAWDVAAFVNSQPRPKADLKKDWQNISAKPVDHPFGPYTDGFTELQHKYGPFQPIVDKRKEIEKMQQSLSLNK